MNVSSFPIRLIGAAVLTCAASAANAAFTFGWVSTGAVPNSTTAATTYATTAGLVAPVTDTLGDLTINDPNPLGKSLTRTVGDYSYTVSTQTNLYSVQSPGIGGPALSVEINTDSLTFALNNILSSSSVVGRDVYNFGASFYLSELTAANAVQGVMSVVATDINNNVQTFSFTQTVNGSSPSFYFRLGSDVALKTVELIAPVVGSNPLVFATVDSVTVGSVPLPAAGWLLVSGLGGMGLFKRRRA
jgi:hypothetical protein